MSLFHSIAKAVGDVTRKVGTVVNLPGAAARTAISKVTGVHILGAADSFGGLKNDYIQGSAIVGGAGLGVLAAPAVAGGVTGLSSIFGSAVGAVKAAGGSLLSTAVNAVKQQAGNVVQNAVNDATARINGAKATVQAANAGASVAGGAGQVAQQLASNPVVLMLGGALLLVVLVRHAGD